MFWIHFTWNIVHCSPQLKKWPEINTWAFSFCGLGCDCQRENKTTLQDLFHYCVGKARAAKGEWSRILLKLMLNPKIVTIIQKSYTPAAPGVVSCAGADQRHERKQNCRLKTVFPGTQTSGDCNSHLRAGWEENTSLCCLWPCGSSGAVCWAPVWGCWIKFPTHNACPVLCAGEGCGGHWTWPNTSQGVQWLDAIWGVQEGFSGNGMIKCKSEFILMSCVCPFLSAFIRASFSFPFCSFIVSGSQRKGNLDYLWF